MFQILAYVFAPLAALLIACYGRKKEALFVWGQGIGYLFFLVTVSVLLMIPIDRALMRVKWTGAGDYFLYLHFGSVSAVFAVGLGIIMGLLSRHCSVIMQIEERIIPCTRRRITPGLVAAHIAVFILLVLTFSYTWGLANYGNVTFEEIVFHLNMPLAGTSQDLIKDYILRTTVKTVIAFGLFELLVFFPSKQAYCVYSRRCSQISWQVFPLRLPEWMTSLGLVVWLLVLLVGANRSFEVISYIYDQINPSLFIEQEYVDPREVTMTFPDNKRNLITIYMESAETSAQDKGNGGFFDVNYIPEMTRLAQENVSFSHTELLEGAAIAPGAGWTIAGLVAESAGLPLKIVSDWRENTMGDYLHFLPGATTIGDILEEAGYKNVIMLGSEAGFAGRTSYYLQHGNYEIMDYDVAVREKVIPEGYRVFWGFEDKRLYDWAKTKLVALSQADQPFNFAMLTVDTHTPKGYVCDLCPSNYEHQYANVLSCSSAQLDAFISWCKEQPFYENTSIVVVGDHASMVANFYGTREYQKYEGDIDRKVYNAFINSAIAPVKQKNRKFTTMDFFPTTLASLGVTIEGERLGLGTNLFSSRETLAEEYGYERVFDELNRPSNFYNDEILFP